MTSSIWVGDRVRLRAREPEDWEAFHAFDEDSDAVRSGWRLTPPNSAARAKKANAEGAEEELDLDEFSLVIASKADNAPVGSINTHQIDRVHGTFAYGISVGTPHHRKGYASEAIVLLLRYMFFERRFQKAEAWVYGYNDASQALHRRMGFVEEGRRRRSHYANGRYHDELLFGMTVEEYTERHT
ncbi:Protein N-acetyltransferase, RimJ/RimL family [Nonomuraea solani]|uniref:Protein N-acetyltransferase, RimJ/RimL family n=1 Tax=Nonomuraea solani TaxID=1144553 RepID=A0A1H5TAB5_9ACTN|nr:GNAT family protein [Nonomuraea solani]SEF59763.1 Protein N-acetyltransferase, RimJ/RimL family [Nonomuraea solani]